MLIDKATMATWFISGDTKCPVDTFAVTANPADPYNLVGQGRATMQTAALSLDFATVTLTPSGPQGQVNIQGSVSTASGKQLTLTLLLERLPLACLKSGLTN
jgi:hypothetical protein